MRSAWSTVSAPAGWMSTCAVRRDCDATWMSVQNGPSRIVTRSSAFSSPTGAQGIRSSGSSRGGRALDIGLSELAESRYQSRLSPSSLPPRVILVKSASREPRFKVQRRTLSVAAALLLTLPATYERVSAASVSSDQAMAPDESTCKCGMKCARDSCCCGDHKLATRPEVRPVGGTVASPCLDSAPCRDSGLPGSPAGRGVAKATALAQLAQLQFDTVGQFLATPAHHLLARRGGARLDEPPEPTGLR